MSPTTDDPAEKLFRQSGRPSDVVEVTRSAGRYLDLYPDGPATRDMHIILIETQFLKFRPTSLTLRQAVPRSSGGRLH